MITIIWDVDDVLNRLMYCWLDDWKQSSRTNIQYKELTENPPHNLLNVSLQEYLSNLDKYRNSDYGKNVLVNKNILNWFNAYGNNYMHIACTARPVETMPNQAWWVFTYYGRWIHTVHMAKTGRDVIGNHHAVTKADFISWINKDVLFIDDSEENVSAVSETGVETMLYPQPWNGSAHSGQEFIEQLNNKLGII